MIVVSKRMAGSIAMLAFTGFCLMMVVGACQRSEQKVADAKGKVADAKEVVAEANQDLKEASRDVRADWEENWVAFKRDIDTRVSDNERRILELRSEVANIDTRYQASYNTSIDEAERRNNELRDRVANYKHEGDANWEVFKTDIGRDFDALKIALGNITIANN